MLFHIAHRADWDAAVASGTYVVASLTVEGFIHLSTSAQFMATAARYYSGVQDLVLLEIDQELLDPALLRFEVATNDEAFPHYYAPLSTSAVSAVHEFASRADGGFDRPTTLG